MFLSCLVFPLMIFIHCPWHVYSLRKLDPQDSMSIFSLPLIRNPNDILTLKKLYCQLCARQFFVFCFYITSAYSIAFHFFPIRVLANWFQIFLTMAQKLKIGMSSVLSLFYSKTQWLLTCNFISTFSHMADTLLGKSDENISLV